MVIENKYNSLLAIASMNDSKYQERLEELKKAKALEETGNRVKEQEEREKGRQIYAQKMNEEEKLKSCLMEKKSKYRSMVHFFKPFIILFISFFSLLYNF